MSVPHSPELMPLVSEAVEAKGFLDEPEIEKIALRLRIPSSRVYGFASQFGELPIHPHRALVRVCTGPSCAVHGSEEILAALGEKAPKEIEIMADTGLSCWHRSPALSVRLAGQETWLMEGIAPGDVDKIIAALEKEDFSDAKPLRDVFPPKVETLPGVELAPWWAAAEKRDLPDGWGPDLIGWVSDHADRAMQCIGDSSGFGSADWKYMAVMKEALNGGSRAPVIVCDTIGAEAENSVNRVATLLHPRAVVAGAALAASACRAKGVVFYVSWEDTESYEILHEAQAELLSGAGIKASVLRGPRHVPSSLDIGRAAVIQGIMLWQAAAEYGWGGARLGDRPVILLPAELAVRLPWVMEEVARKGDSEEGVHLMSLVGCVDHPSLLQMPQRKKTRELFSLLEEAVAGSGLKAIQALGTQEGPVPYVKEDIAALDTASGLLLLDHSTCMVEWARYLFSRAEWECCGGCVPGRTAAAATGRIIEAVRQGRAGEGQAMEWQEVASISEAAGKLALCPRLQEVLRPGISCLNNFREEFLAHAVDGICKAGACVLPARSGT
jgi:hypothetical protein